MTVINSSGGSGGSFIDALKNPCVRGNAPPQVDASAVLSRGSRLHSDRLASLDSYWKL
jgi:hypothetical protein